MPHSTKAKSYSTKTSWKPLVICVVAVVAISAVAWKGNPSQSLASEYARITWPSSMVVTHIQNVPATGNIPAFINDTYTSNMPQRQILDQVKRALVRAGYTVSPSDTQATLYAENGRVQVNVKIPAIASDPHSISVSAEELR